jgi:hypothetical protein
LLETIFKAILYRYTLPKLFNRYLIGKVGDINDGVGGAGGVPGQPAPQEEVAEVGGAGGQHQFVSLHMNGRVKGSIKPGFWIRIRMNFSCWIRITEGKNDPQQKGKKNFMF